MFATYGYIMLLPAGCPSFSPLQKDGIPSTSTPWARPYTAAAEATPSLRFFARVA